MERHRRLFTRDMAIDAPIPVRRSIERQICDQLIPASPNRRGCKAAFNGRSRQRARNRTLFGPIRTGAESASRRGSIGQPEASKSAFPSEVDRQIILPRFQWSASPASVATKDGSRSAPGERSVCVNHRWTWRPPLWHVSCGRRDRATVTQESQLLAARTKSCVRAQCSQRKS